MATYNLRGNTRHQGSLNPNHLNYTPQQKWTELPRIFQKPNPFRGQLPLEITVNGQMDQYPQSMNFHLWQFMQQQLAAQEQRQLKEDRRQAQREEERRQDDLRKDQMWEWLLARSTDSRSEAESPHSSTRPSERIVTLRREKM